MTPPNLTSATLTARLKGRQAVQAGITGMEQLCVRFSDGTELIVESSAQGLHVWVESPGRPAGPGTAARPSARQLEYLVFIDKYLKRFGRAPAETDIQRHTLVSAPSVNQMMQMLERRGFIARTPGVARSIRLCIDLGAQ